jgi:hypothetical protein
MNFSWRIHFDEFWMVWFNFCRQQPEHPHIQHLVTQNEDRQISSPNTFRKTLVALCLCKFSADLSTVKWTTRFFLVAFTNAYRWILLWNNWTQSQI